MLQNVAIPPAPDHEASQDRGQGRAPHVACAIPPGPWTATLAEDSTVPIGGMAGIERWPRYEFAGLRVIRGRGPGVRLRAGLAKPPWICKSRGLWWLRG